MKIIYSISIFGLILFVISLLLTPPALEKVKKVVEFERKYIAETFQEEYSQETPSSNIFNSLILDSTVVFLDRKRTLFYYNLEGDFKFFIDLDLVSPAYIIKNGSMVNVFDNALSRILIFSSQGILQRKINVTDYISSSNHKVIHANVKNDTLYVVSFKNSEMDFKKKNIFVNRFQVNTKKIIGAEEDLGIHFMNSNGYFVSDSQNLFLVSSFISKLTSIKKNSSSSFYTLDSINTDSAYVIIGNKAKTDKRKKAFIHSANIYNDNIFFLSSSHNHVNNIVDLYDIKSETYKHSIDLSSFADDHILSFTMNDSMVVFSTRDKIEFLKRKKNDDIKI